MSGRLKLAAWFSILFLACSGIACAQQQVIGAPPEASNMKLVGTSDLQARSAYQPTIHHQGDRWIAYIGHHGGTDDIPAPVNPHDRQGRAERHLDRRRHRSRAAEISAPHSRARKASMKPAARRWCGSATARRCRRAIATRSTCCAPSAARRMRSGTSPIPPIPCWSRGSRGLKDTHKNWWECDTGIAFLVSGAPDWRTRRMTQVYDLSDPAHPQKIRDFGLPGQEPGSTGAVPTELHGPISTGPARQPRLFRLRHQQGRLPADRRSREAAQRAEGADAGQSALCRRSRGCRCRRSTAPTPRFRCWACRSRNSPRTRTARPATS